MSSKWHRLHLSDQSLPPLLFQYTWTRQDYEIYITDLTYIWSERLPQRQITKRAEENATTIDPEEDPEQLNVLLEKIGEALKKGKDSVNLSRGAQADSLEITTTTKLPAPLKPLRWILKLSREPSSYLTSKILFPLLKEETNREDRQRSLLRQLKQKDYVLNKLFDKIENIGVDLGSVFPSAAGSRKSHKSITRSEAARFIKGIEPFEEEAWLAETESSGAGLATHLLQEISGSGDFHDFSFIQPRDEWWRDLTKRPESSAKESSSAREETPKFDNKHDDIALLKHTKPEEESTAIHDNNDDGDNDEFQRQETPPRLKSEPVKSKTPPRRTAETKSHSPLPLPSKSDDEATASDSEPEPEQKLPRNRTPTRSKTPEPPVSQPQKGPKRPKGGLGTIGGKKKKEKEPSPMQGPSSLKPQHPPKSSEKEGPPNDSPPPPSPAPPAAIKSKRLGKLGMIGGISKAKAKDPIVDDGSVPISETKAASPDQESPAKPKHTQDTTKQIAKKKESPLPAPPAMGKSDPEPPAEPETEDQRADRRREELKRALEAKSKAPAKKKRRF